MLKSVLPTEQYCRAYSGYRPNLTMHGTEAIVPLSNAMNQAMSGMGLAAMILPIS
jgi:hypothetical protein